MAQGQRRPAARRAGRDDRCVGRCHLAGRGQEPAILRIDVDPAPPAPVHFGCDTRTDAQIDALIKFVAKDTNKMRRFTTCATGLIEKHCVGCHADFGLKAGRRAEGTPPYCASSSIRTDGSIPGDPDAGRLHSACPRKGSGKIMPPENGHTLIKDPGYLRLLLERVRPHCRTIVPGERRRIKVSTSLRSSRPRTMHLRRYSQATLGCRPRPIGRRKSRASAASSVRPTNI